MPPGVFCWPGSALRERYLNPTPPFTQGGMRLARAGTPPSASSSLAGVPNGDAAKSIAANAVSGVAATTPGHRRQPGPARAA